MKFIHHKISFEERLNDDGREFMVAISEKMKAMELTLEESSGNAATMKLRKMALDCSRLLYSACKVVSWQEPILDEDWQDEVEMAAIIKAGPQYEFESILKIVERYEHQGTS